MNNVALTPEQRLQAKELIIRRARLNRIVKSREQKTDLDLSPLTEEEVNQAVKELIELNQEEMQSKMESKKKPDWITDEEWKVNPNVYHWEQSRKAMQLQKQSKPLTREEKIEQMRQRQESLKSSPLSTYHNQFHKESTERKLRKLEEQKKLKLNAKEEVKKIFEMHDRIARNYPNESK